MELLSNLENLVLFGDFNFADIGWPLTIVSNELTNSKNIFTNFVQSSNLHQLITNPTRFRINNLPSTLDLIFTNDDQLLTEPVIRTPVGNSDHVVITTNIQFLMEYNHLSENTVIHEITNFENLSLQLRDVDWPLLLGSLEHPEEVWNNFINIIDNYKRFNTTKKTYYRNKLKPWINGELISLIRHKRKLWRKYKRTGDTRDLQTHKNYTGILKKYNNEARMAYEESTVSCNDSKKLYKYIRSAMSSKVSIPLLKKHDETICHNTCEVANIVEDTFYKVFAIEPSQNQFPIISNPRVIPKIDYIDFSPEIIQRHIDKLKNN
uniref:Uncharacterized protein LOC114336248 n=1 Tax=Diabrotica virgifera virgifera TaxID=50390 RepID=A0A6P7GC01_DIAVI